MVSIDLHEKARQWVEQGKSSQNSEEIQALQDYLNDECTPEQAAAVFTHNLSNEPSEHPDYQRSYFLLGLVAREFPDTHDRLIDLLKAIKCLPPIVQNGQQAVDAKGRRFWDDLPGLVKELQRMSQFLAHFMRRQDHRAKPENHFQLLDLSSFITKVIQHNLVQDKPLSKLLEHGPVLVLKEAVEDRDPRQTRDNCRLLAQNTLVTAAARYILDVGKYIYECDYESFGMKLEMKKHPKSGYRIGYVLELVRKDHPISRWQFWIDRFSDMYYRDDLDESTRELAYQASQRMEALAAFGSLWGVL